jgi:hypothetical protein
LDRNRLIRAVCISSLQEGLKQLRSLLDSVDSRRALDEFTLRLRPVDSVTGTPPSCCPPPPLPVPPAPPPAHITPHLPNAATTWPGLASKLAHFITLEMEAAKKKNRSPEAALSATMVQLVQAAEDDRRSGENPSSAASHPTC